MIFQRLIRTRQIIFQLQRPKSRCMSLGHKPAARTCASGSCGEGQIGAKERAVGWKHRRSPGYGHRTVSGYTSSRSTLGGSDRSGIFTIGLHPCGGQRRSLFDRWHHSQPACRTRTDCIDNRLRPNFQAFFSRKSYTVRAVSRAVARVLGSPDEKPIWRSRHLRSA